MKKLFISTILITFFIASTHTFAQASFGVKGSFNMYNLTVKDKDNKKIEYSMIPAFDAGVFAEILVADQFYFRPEILFAAKGGKLKNTDPKTSFHLSYLELPLEFLYKGDLSGGKILLGVGPYLAMGIGGKRTSGGTDRDIKFKNDVTLSEMVNAYYYKPFDFGANLLAGYEFKNRFSFAINASLGLINIESKIAGTQPSSSTKNNGFGLTLGYRIK